MKYVCDAGKIPIDQSDKQAFLTATGTTTLTMSCVPRNGEKKRFFFLNVIYMAKTGIEQSRWSGCEHETISKMNEKNNINNNG